MGADVIVIGGGFAGLSAATACAAGGARVLVLESRPTLGGRATAFTDPASGERVDNGQHLIVGGYHETFRFLRRIGREDAIDLQRSLTVDFVDRDGIPSRLACPSWPAPLHLVVGAVRWRALGWRDRLAVARLARVVNAHGGTGCPPPPQASARHAVAREGGRRPELTPGTVREWLAACAQTPRAIEMLWEPLAVAALNQSIDLAAAAPFIAVLARVLGSRRDAALGIPRVPLDELYAVPSARFLEDRGSHVRLSAPAVVSGFGAPLTVHVRHEVLHAPVVICTVPWHALADVLVDAPPPLGAVVAAASATAASAIVTVNLWLDRAVTAGTFVGLPGRTMQWVFDKRMVFGGGASHLSLVSSGADALIGVGNQELIDRALDELRAALPAARAASVRRAVVVRERQATFSVAVGQPRRPDTVTGVPGLLLAGDWIATGLPATIESAVISGHRAADAALDALQGARARE